MMRIASLKYRRAPAGGRGVNGRWHETFGRRMTSSAEGKCRNSARKTAEKQPKMVLLLAADVQSEVQCRLAIQFAGIDQPSRFGDC